MTSTNNPSEGFNNLGIAPKLLEIISKQSFTTPTPIQKQSIPIAISGKDLMGIAQTGTGKTFAFGIPLLQRIASTSTRALVLVPTRELAVQVNDSLRIFYNALNIKSCVIIGGESSYRQIKELRKNPNLIIATPGRLNDLLEQKSLDLKQVSVLVLDEADRMLDMGFAPQLKKILRYIPAQRQTMLFSATMDQEIMGIAASFLKLPVRIEIAAPGTTATDVTQEIIMINREGKLDLLKKTLGEYRGSALVFCRTKFTARKVASILKNSGLTAAEIHSNRSLNQRLEALQGFKVGKYRVLVATDIAARGIDVNNIELVLNYDLPEHAADYVHRIGRTARAGKAGHAISFATPDQHSDIRDIERLIKKTIAVKKMAVSAAPGGAVAGVARMAAAQTRFGQNSFGNRNNNGARRTFRNRNDDRRPFGRKNNNKRFDSRRSDNRPSGGQNRRRGFPKDRTFGN